MTFDDLKAAWPTGKRGSGLQKAAAKFAKIPASEHADMMRGLEVWKASRQWQQGYVPHIATWLNQAQWKDVLEDEPESADTFTDEEYGMLAAYYRKLPGGEDICRHDPPCPDGEEGNVLHARKLLAVLKVSRS